MHDDAMPTFPVNIGTMDRIVRILAGLVLFVLGSLGMFGAPLDLILRVGALLPLLTGAFGWCPLYRILHIDTLRTTA